MLTAPLKRQRCFSAHPASPDRISASAEAAATETAGLAFPTGAPPEDSVSPSGVAGSGLHRRGWLAHPAESPPLVAEPMDSKAPRPMPGDLGWWSIAICACLVFTSLPTGHNPASISPWLLTESHPTIARPEHCPTASVRPASCDNARGAVGDPPPQWSNATALAVNAPSSDSGPFEAVYDPASNFDLLVAGENGPIQSWAVVNDTYTPLHPALSPNTGVGGALGYASTLDAPIYLSTATDPATTWTFANSTWSLLATTGGGPRGTAAASGHWVDDPSDACVLFYYWAGSSGGSQFWQLEDGAWTNLTSTEPPPDLATANGTAGATEVMVYSPPSGRVVLFGGPSKNSSGRLVGATWSFHGGVWSQVCGACGPWGGGLGASSVVFDSTLQAIVAFGSDESAGVTSLGGSGNETWVLSGDDWSDAVGLSSPPSRSDAVLADNPRGSDLILFGGRGPTCEGCAPPLVLNDSWQFGGTPIPTYEVDFVVVGGLSGAIIFNGAFQRSGSSVLVTNGTYSLTPSSTGTLDPSQVWLHFQSWIVNGGLTLLGSRIVVNGTGGTVTAAFAPFPRLTFEEDGCGPVLFNGTAYASNVSDNFLLSGNPYNLSASNCTAFRFVGWTFSGGVSIASTTAANTSVNITANGTITAVYGEVGTGPVIDWLIANPSTLSLGNLTTITAEATGGVSPLAYRLTWTRGNCTEPVAAEWSCEPTATGVDVVTLDVSDAIGHTAQSSTTVIVLSAATAPIITSFSASPSQLIVGTVVEFIVSWIGGTPPITFYYSNLPRGCVSISTPTNPCVPSAAGTYTVSVVVSGADGRTSYATTRVSVASQSSASAPPNPLVPDWLVGVAVGATVMLLGSLTFAAYRARRRPPKRDPAVEARRRPD